METLGQPMAREENYPELLSKRLRVPVTSHSRSQDNLSCLDCDAMHERVGHFTKKRSVYQPLPVAVLFMGIFRA
jgi:hypothetical protein